MVARVTVMADGDRSAGGRAPRPGLEQRAAEAGTDTTNTRWVWALAAAIAAFALVVRAPALGPSSLWRDDAWQAFSRSATNASDVVGFGLTSPGFSLVLALVLRLPGRFELLAQAVPLLASSCSAGLLVVFAYRAGSRLYAAATAGLLLSLSVANITYGVRVKPYALDGLICLVVVAAGLAVANSGGQRRWWSVGLASSAAALSSAHGFLAAAATFSVLVIVYRGDWRRWSGPLGVAGCAFLAAIPLYLLRNQQNTALTHFWGGHYLDPTRDSLYRGTVGYVQGYLPQAASDLSSHTVFLGVVAAAVIALVVRLSRHRPVVALICFAPVGVQIALAFGHKMPFGTRADLPLVPVTLLGLSLAAPDLPRLVAKRAALIAVLTLVVVPLGIVAAVDQRSSYPDIDLRPLVESVHRAAGPDDVVFADPISTYPVVLYWGSGFARRREPESFTGFAPLPDDRRLKVEYEPRIPAVQRSAVLEAMAARKHIFLIETDEGAAGGVPSAARETDLTAPLRQDPGYRLDEVWVSSQGRATSWRPRT